MEVLKKRTFQREGDSPKLQSCLEQDHLQERQEMLGKILRGGEGGGVNQYLGKTKTFYFFTL